MRIPFYLVAAALLAASKAEDNVSIKRLGASTESEPQHQEVNTISIEAFSTNSHDDSNEDPPVDEQRSSRRSRLERGSSRRSRISNEDPPVQVESRSECVTDSTGTFTNLFYYSTGHKCAQDCDSANGYPCMGKPECWLERFYTLADCCGGGGRDPDVCVPDSMGFTNKFYIDYSTGLKCAQDCDSANGLPCMGRPEVWKQRFNTLEECCDGVRLDPDVCVPAAEGRFTNKFYIDYLHWKCAQDCDSASGLPCMGKPEFWNSQRFHTLEECCDRGVGREGCFTNGFYINFGADANCAQDCNSANGLPCMGRPEVGNNERFNTLEECCDRGLGRDPDVCVPDSEGRFTNKFYIDHSAGPKCAQDCDSASGLPCMGKSALGGSMYFDTAEDCAGWLFGS